MDFYGTNVPICHFLFLYLHHKSEQILNAMSIHLPSEATLSELSNNHQATLLTSSLSHWTQEPQVLCYGAIVICRHGSARIRVNFNEWQLYRGAVITLFPNDVVLVSEMTDDAQSGEPFQVEMLQYNMSLLREASLQLEQTVYSSLREDRCRTDKPVVTNIIDSMFRLLKIYFDQKECTCLSQLVLLQLKAFFMGFHEYLQRNPENRPDEVKSRRVRELFNQFMHLMEQRFRESRDVNDYASHLNISAKYLTNISRQVTGHTPKTIIDQYTILQIKNQLRMNRQSIKEIAWEYHFSDVSFFCRYFKKHTGITPLEFRNADLERR